MLVLLVYYTLERTSYVTVSFRYITQTKLHFVASIRKIQARVKNTLKHAGNSANNETDLEASNSIVSGYRIWNQLSIDS